MRGAVLVALMVIVTPLMGVASADADIRMRFTVGQGGDGEFYHADLENSSLPGEITITFGILNNTLYVAESNVRNVTLYLGGILADIPEALINGVRAYLEAMGSLNIKFAGNGTNRYTIVGVPEVFSAVLDGSDWDGYTYSSGTVEFELDMSEHDVRLNFVEVEDLELLFTIMVAVIFIVAIGVAAFMMRRWH
jgi:hypothetical protein